MFKTITAAALGVGLAFGTAQAATATFDVAVTADGDLPVADAEILAPGTLGTIEIVFDETETDLDRLNGTVVLTVGIYEIGYFLTASRTGSTLELLGELVVAGGGFTGSDGADYNLFPLGGGELEIDLGTTAALTGEDLANLLTGLDASALSGIFFAEFTTPDQVFGVSFDFVGAEVPLPAGALLLLTGLAGFGALRRRG